MTKSSRTMCHAVGTANKHYLLEDSVQNNANIAFYINNMMTEEAEQTTTEHPTTSETPQIGKVAAWLASAEEAQSLPGTWCSGRKMWSEKEEEIFLHATRFLPRHENLPRKEIVDAIAVDDVASAMMAQKGGQFTTNNCATSSKAFATKTRINRLLNLNFLCYMSLLKVLL